MARFLPRSHANDGLDIATNHPFELQLPAVTASWHRLHPRKRGAWTVQHRDGAWGRFDPETRTAALVDPRNDPDLPALGPALVRGRLVGYRLGRRAVVKTRDRYLKVVRPSRLTALLNAHAVMKGAETTIETPRVLTSGASGVAGLSTVPGRSLHDIIRMGDATTTAVRAVARALAELHAIPPTADLPTRSPDETKHWTETVARLEPAVAESLGTIATGLPPVESSPTCVVHGDLHDKNILLDLDRVGLIDLDGLAMGAPEDDLANLAVHLRLRFLQAGEPDDHALRLMAALYETYDSERPLDSDRLERVERHTWFRLACLYRYRGSSRHRPETLLRLALGHER